MLKKIMAAPLCAALTLAAVCTVSAAVDGNGSWKLSENGQWYCTDRNGSIMTGFVNDDGHLYYLSPADGFLVTEDGTYEGSALVISREHNGCFGEILAHEHLWESVTVQTDGSGHWETVENGQAPKVICGYCDREFETMEAFERHALDDHVITPVVQLSYRLDRTGTTKKVWVQDAAAGSRTVMQCRICGAEEETR